MNKKFPNWVTADIILERMVDNHFGIYITQSGQREDTINVSLVPMELIPLIPEEDRETFKKIHDEMMNDLNTKIGIVKLFNSEFKHTMNIANNRYHLQYKIERAMRDYEVTHNVIMKNIFKELLGIEGYGNPDIKVSLRLI